MKVDEESILSRYKAAIERKEMIALSLEEAKTRDLTDIEGQDLARFLEKTGMQTLLFTENGTWYVPKDLRGSDYFSDRPKYYEYLLSQEYDHTMDMAVMQDYIYAPLPAAQYAQRYEMLLEEGRLQAVGLEEATASGLTEIKEHDLKTFMESTGQEHLLFTPKGTWFVPPEARKSDYFETHPPYTEYLAERQGSSVAEVYPASLVIAGGPGVYNTIEHFWLKLVDDASSRSKDFNMMTGREFHYAYDDSAKPYIPEHSYLMGGKKLVDTIREHAQDLLKEAGGDVSRAVQMMEEAKVRLENAHQGVSDAAAGLLTLSGERSAKEALELAAAGKTEDITTDHILAKPLRRFQVSFAFAYPVQPNYPVQQAAIVPVTARQGEVFDLDFDIYINELDNLPPYLLFDPEGPKGNKETRTCYTFDADMLEAVLGHDILSSLRYTTKDPQDKKYIKDAVGEEAAIETAARAPEHHPSDVIHFLRAVEQLNALSKGHVLTHSEEGSILLGTTRIRDVPAMLISVDAEVTSPIHQGTEDLIKELCAQVMGKSVCQPENHHVLKLFAQQYRTTLAKEADLDAQQGIS